MPGERPDPQHVPVDRDVRQVGELVDVDEQLRRREPQLHHRDEAVAPGDQARLRPVPHEQPDGVLDARGAEVLERRWHLHGSPHVGAHRDQRNGARTRPLNRSLIDHGRRAPRTCTVAATTRARRRRRMTQQAHVRADRERAEDREEPHDLGVAPAHGVPEDRGPAGGGPVAAAPGAPPRPDRRVAPGGGPRPGRRPATADTSEPDVPLPLPLRGAALARRGDRAAAASTATRPRCSRAARASCRCSSCASPPPNCSSTSTTSRPRPPPRGRRREPARRRAVPARRPGALDAARRASTR